MLTNASVADIRRLAILAEGLARHRRKRTARPVVIVEIDGIDAQHITFMKNADWNIILWPLPDGGHDWTKTGVWPVERHETWHWTKITFLP